jgi:beta-galactosidase GanA
MKDFYWYRYHINEMAGQGYGIRGAMGIRQAGRSRRLIAAAALTAVLQVASAQQPVASALQASAAPTLVKRDGRFALLVDGAPFLMLAAQANNSSNYPLMLPKVWPAIEQMHANTLEIPVAWEQLEPQEGHFDFSYLDTLLFEAREHRVRLVLLWFATWKNNSPSYTPEWAKLDNRRFPRVINAANETKNSLSPLFAATLESDRKAFAALMRHLKAADPQHTVIMVQVENETGTYGAVRDYSPTAQKLFESSVPAALVSAMKLHPGTWRAVFGKDADEFFHAWYVARFVDQVAAAGKAEYSLPMYVNAALRDAFKYQDPSTYSSGGPTWNVIDIWKAAAPSIDVIAPDIYNSDYAFYLRTLEQYSRADNPLMVPETGNKVEYARYFFAVLGHGGLGFSPFGIDLTGYANYPLGADKVGPDLFAQFGRNYLLAEPVMRPLARLSFAGKVWGGSEPTDSHEQRIALGRRWQVALSYGRPQFGPDPPTGNPLPAGGALIAELAPDEFLVTGFQVRVNFESARQDGRRFMLARVEEGHYDGERWVFERVWNGDQTDWGLNFTSAAQWLKVRLATY